MSTSAATHQKQKYRQTLTEADEKDIFDRIDLSNLDSYSSESAINQREEFKDSIRVYDPSPEITRIFLPDPNKPKPRTRRHDDYWCVKPNYKNMAGQWVTPTRINSLLTQNPGTVIGTPEGQYGTAGPSRPARQFYWWRQTDEGYYIKAANKRLASFLAKTEPNYYVVEGNSKHRRKFKCPHQPNAVRTIYGRDPDDDELDPLFRTILFQNRTVYIKYTVIVR